jgi:uncharacterized membrane protein HdeD (DUF308 family)
MAETTANPPAFGAGDAAAFPWWVMLLEGIAALLLGILLFVYPGVTTVTAVWFIALYWVITGVIALVSLYWDRTQWGWKVFWGIVSIAAGWFILTNPIIGAGTLLWAFALILGIQGILLGVVQVVAAFQGAGWGRGVLGVISFLFGALILMYVWQAALVIPWVFGIFAVIGGFAAIFYSFQLRKMTASSGMPHAPAPA